MNKTTYLYSKLYLLIKEIVPASQDRDQSSHDRQQCIKELCGSQFSFLLVFQKGKLLSENCSVCYVIVHQKFFGLHQIQTNLYYSTAIIFLPYSQSQQLTVFMEHCPKLTHSPFFVLLNMNTLGIIQKIKSRTVSYLADRS